jgi:hypothetical protein
MGMFTNPRMRPSLGTSESNLIFTDFTPSTAMTACRASFSICVCSGQAGVVSMIVKETTLSSPISSWRIMLSVTRSLCNSGSCTLLNAAKIASFVIFSVICFTSV